ncbi:MAG: CBS domain-containing protein [Actinophytocola sp.]|uniref:CBS domain-containing protein n=1 Tax=Actinophytocola sp. TaxID=1872138 RepID=UPI001320D078|nr:CBS domain-containing protein [Actinophytocola sp.]MPZ78973.1 CBS domain-containing protein [Actinophytocola sp.]
MRARDIMTAPVITVRPATTIKEAAALLAGHGFTALPVLDDDHRLIGIVTEADLVRDRVPRDPRALIHPGHRPVPGPVTTTVGEVMTTPAVAMGPGTDVAVLAKALLDAGHRSMPIVEGSTVVGIVTRRDIVRAIARDDDTIAADVRHRLEIYGSDRRWQVEVQDGVVSIADQFDSHQPNAETDRHVATVLAEAVPGVVRATAFAARAEDDR